MTEDQFEGMNDKEFLETYKGLNFIVDLHSKYAYLSLNNNIIMPEAEEVAERRFNQYLETGDLLLKLNTNNSETCIRRSLAILYDSFTSNVSKAPEEKTFRIDGSLLENNQVIDFLKKCHDNGFIDELIIIGDDYILNDEVYNEIKYFPKIKVANFQSKHDNVFSNNNYYTLISGINSNSENEMDFVFKADMPDEILKTIIPILNNKKVKNCKYNIDIRFYNPERTVQLIERLDKLGLDNDINIKILGYTLTENSDIYKRLTPLLKKRKIEVSYVCCHDLLENYTNEPFLVDNFYISELEPSGKTDLSTYIKILELLESFENKTKGVTSTIEKIMTAYQYLNDNYYYDPDSGRTKEYGSTRDIDKILDTDQIVCVGYANLLSIMCRRIGVPMFTYEAPQHELNIARVQEKDKDGNITLDTICTFDATNDCGTDKRNADGSIDRYDWKNSYTFFGLDPETSLHLIGSTSFITLANSLSLPREELEKYAYLSLSEYSGGLRTTYSSLSYMISMLHLMGYNFDYTKTNIFDIIAELQERGRVGEIPREMILKAARNVERRKNPEMPEEEFSSHMTNIENDIINSINSRIFYYDQYSPAKIHLNKEDIIHNNKLDTIRNVKTYSMGIPPHEHVDIDKIDMGPIYYNELENLATGEERHINRQPPSSDTFENNESEKQEEVEEDKLYSQEKIIEEPEVDVIQEKIIEDKPIIEENKEEANGYNQLDQNNQQVQTITLNSGKRPNSNQIVINGNIEINGEVNITINNYGQNPNNLSNVTIAGTTIRRPKSKTPEETKEEYEDRINDYYEEYLPQAINETNTTYRLTKDQIIQDLPFNSFEEQIFNSIGMTDEEIEESRRMLK